MKILGIETSCDETACAIVENGTTELASSVASSQALHEKTGGVVPEVAARKQLEAIVPVIEDTLEKFKYTSDGNTAAIDAIAVTVGPGLIGSLLVGLEAAKTLALVWEKPLVPVNHLVGHVYANFLGNRVIEFPAVVLLVSGGHTDLVLMRDHGVFEYIGGTLDDAAGEAFDKTARLLGLANYLGGVKLSKVAGTCIENKVAGRLPRPLLTEDTFDFSFSGLKTAVRRLIEQENPDVVSTACEFETAVVDVLVTKTIKAAQKYNVKSILLGGGVSANIPLRTRLKVEADMLGISLHVPEISLCTDNAIYIASAAFFNYIEVPLANIKVNPSLGFMDSLR